jgi:hypothetical protein
MGSHTRDNGPILTQKKNAKILTRPLQKPSLVSVPNSAELRLRVRASLAPSNPPLPLQLNTSLWGLYTGPSLCCCSGCDSPQWLSQNCPKKLLSWPTKLPRTCCCSSRLSCPKSAARVAVPALKAAQNLPLTAVSATRYNSLPQAASDCPKTC